MNRPGRNDPCHCGSGKKYKKCHWDADEKAASDERSKQLELGRMGVVGQALRELVERAEDPQAMAQDMEAVSTMLANDDADLPGTVELLGELMATGGPLAHVRMDVDPVRAALIAHYNDAEGEDVHARLAQVCARAQASLAPPELIERLHDGLTRVAAARSTTSAQRRAALLGLMTMSREGALALNDGASPVLELLFGIQCEEEAEKVADDLERFSWDDETRLHAELRQPEHIFHRVARELFEDECETIVHDAISILIDDTAPATLTADEYLLATQTALGRSGAEDTGDALAQRLEDLADEAFLAPLQERLESWISDEKRSETSRKDLETVAAALELAPGNVLARMILNGYVVRSADEEAVLEACKQGEELSAAALPRYAEYLEQQGLAQAARNMRTWLAAHQPG